MILLALETTSAQGSLAIARLSHESTELLYSQTWKRQNSHGELVTSAIEEALKASHLNLTNIDAFGVGYGPGSFTGIRVGLSVIKALAYVHDKPIYTLSSLDLLAFSISPYQIKSPLLTLINAHKSQCYLATYHSQKNSWKSVCKPQAYSVLRLDTLIKKPHLCVGDGFSSYHAQLAKPLLKKLIRTSFVDDYPHAKTIVQIVAHRQKRLRPKSWKELDALYIRSSEAEEKLKAGTLKPLPQF